MRKYKGRARRWQIPNLPNYRNVCVIIFSNISEKIQYRPKYLWALPYTQSHAPHQYLQAVVWNDQSAMPLCNVYGSSVNHFSYMYQYLVLTYVLFENNQEKMSVPLSDCSTSMDLRPVPFPLKIFIVSANNSQMTHCFQNAAQKFLKKKFDLIFV